MGEHGPRDPGPQDKEAEPRMTRAFDRLRSVFEPVFRRHEMIQVAALCLREGTTGREVLMVTSRGTRRWVLPKGWPMKGRTLAGAALREAWEEAGVVGTVDDAPVGWYGYDKIRKDALPVPCRVEVFRVTVADLARDWPEGRQRRREWMSLDRAATEVAEPQLQALLRRLA
jgi:8-oxo-dGTP pyrophosphatase MutT (NUDIX family)